MGCATSRAQDSVPWLHTQLGATTWTLDVLLSTAWWWDIFGGGRFLRALFTTSPTQTIKPALWWCGLMLAKTTEEKMTSGQLRTRYEQGTEGFLSIN
eukprot:m.129099 g.129099  ORF g.129099 m.129099 type:complete len:97 (+) comp16752_c0_seq4:1366-1656(+)